MRRSGRIPAVWLVLGGIVSVQVGAAVAKGLFGVVPPTTLVWLRLATSSVILLLVVRPRTHGRTRGDWLTALAFGACLTAMNWAIYQAFARIPLGVAVTVEFLGPLSVAILSSRRPRDLIWAVLAAAGVVLLGFAPASLSVAGVLYALLAGAAWAGYILLSARTGRQWPGLSGLAVASAVGLAVLAWPALVLGGESLRHPGVLFGGVAIGLLSSVIPYSLEMVALRRIPAGVFGVLMSLEPAAAALAAMLLLRELLTATQWIALACVVTASIGATRTAAIPREPTAL